MLVLSPNCHLLSHVFVQPDNTHVIVDPCPWFARLQADSRRRKAHFQPLGLPRTLRTYGIGYIDAYIGAIDRPALILPRDALTY